MISIDSKLAISRYKGISKEEYIIASEIQKFIINCKSMLDIGAGSGRIALELCKSKNVQEVTCVDPVKYENKITDKSITWQHKDWEDYYPKLDYDAILMSHVLYLIDSGNRESFLDKAINFLGKNGMIFIVENRLEGLFGKWLLKACRLANNYSALPGTDQAEDYLLKRGFEVKEHNFEVNIPLKELSSFGLEIIPAFLSFDIGLLGNKLPEISHIFSKIQCIPEKLIVAIK